MKRFTKLFLDIESTSSSNKKIEYLVEYFKTAPPQDKLWVIALFSHKRPKRTVKTSLLREWAAELANIPLWLFEDTYHIVGDLAETISKVIPESENTIEKSLSDWINFLAEMAQKDEEFKKDAITNAWLNLGSSERFLLNKLITGGFRMGVSQKTIVKALAKTLKKEESIIAHSLMGNWTPTTINFDELLLDESNNNLDSKPYPFYLAHAIDKEIKELGSPNEWLAEYKWDGIRGQLIKRNGEIYLWSRGEELITHQFPEFESFKSIESDFVLDGEILIFQGNEIQSFNLLQKRLGRKKPSLKMTKEIPAIIMSYDLLELNGEDLRSNRQDQRRKVLEKLYNQTQIHEFKLSETIAFESWTFLETIREGARSLKAEGLMLKSGKGSYQTGRKKGDWYKWKLDPFTIDAVMLYAQRGHGRRANLFTDFTFAVKQDDKLLPIAKAYSGLTDDEFREISRFVKANTIERFGPVSSVKPELVFEIAFEAVFESKRHKSGVAVRFPRILRWRKDKTVKDIDTLDNLKQLII